MINTHWKRLQFSLIVTVRGVSYSILGFWFTVIGKWFHYIYSSYFTYTINSLGCYTHQVYIYLIKLTVTTVIVWNIITTCSTNIYNYYQLKKVALLNIVCKPWCIFFRFILGRTAFIWKINILYDYNVFTVTFDVSLLNKIINLFQTPKNVLITNLTVECISHVFYFVTVCWDWMYCGICDM